MEIGDYVITHGRRVVLAVVATALAAGVAATLAVRAGPQYRATSRASASALTGNATGAALVMYVENFTQALGAETLIDEVAAKLHTSPRAIRKGFSVSRVGLSSYFDVHFTSRERALVAPAVAAGTQDAIKALAAPDLDQARQSLRTANDQVDAAQRKVTALRTLSGTPFPDNAYQLAVQTVVSLQAQIASAKAAKDNARADALTLQLVQATNDRNRLAPLALQYEQASQDLSAAQSDTRRAGASLQELQTIAGSATSRDVVGAPVVIKESVARNAARQGALAGGVTLVALIALFAILEALHPSRARARRATRQNDESLRDTSSRGSPTAQLVVTQFEDEDEHDRRGATRIDL